MESESAKQTGSPPESAGSASPDEASRKQSAHETITSSASSFRGLVGGPGGSAPGSSMEDIKPGPAEAAQMLGIGRTFGRYQIRKTLGSGSMGSVFLAHDSQLNRLVALKVPRFEHNAASELAQRLYREARAAATLNHPNICPIYDVSEHGGTCFIAMGYVSGQPLSAYIASKKQQPEREAAKVVRKVALALQEAHAHGILHRDLKPTNIMIDKRGEPIVMDFGVACWFEDQTQTRLTQQGSLIGTPAYMSPEQIEGRAKVGPASDVYSLGVLFYQILTGRCPFEGTVLNVISQVLHEAPPDATQFRPDLSPELIAICNRAMQKNPADRFASMLDFAKALTAFLNGAPRADKLPKDPSESKDASEVETIEFARPKPVRGPRPLGSPALPALPRRANRSRQPKKTQKNWIIPAIAAGSVTALLVIGAALGAMLTRSRGTPQDSTTNPVSERVAAPPAVPETLPARVAVRDASAVEPPALSSRVAIPSAAPNLRPATGNPLTKSDPPINKDTAAVSPPAGGAPVKNATSAASISRQTSIQANVIEPSPVSKPAVLPSQPTTTPPRDSPRRAAGGVEVSRAASPVAAPDDNDSDRQASSKRDEPDPPSKRARRDARPEPPGGGPPPEGPEGQRPFDGGPAKGMTIEEYFRKRDVNNDGKLDPSELPMHIILRADRNKDGELSLRELQQAFKRRGRKLFTRPTPEEMRHLPRRPRGGPGPAGDGPDPFEPGERPPNRAGQNGF